MTNVWGPMGWMTLHSISVCYPDDPSDADKKILNEFMNAFGTAITCFHCRQHFQKMFGEYKKGNPTWLNSKRDLFLAVCRMHNAVNKRLDKPQAKTVVESIEWLKRATSYTSAKEFREKYSNYLIGDWRHNWMTGEGQAGYNSSLTVKKINEEYWNKREVTYDQVAFEEDDIVNYSNGYKSEHVSIPKFNLNALLGRRR